MTNIELRAMVAQLQELEGFMAEISGEVEAIKDSIKAEMNNRNVETIELEDRVIRYQTILSNRFDSTAFKKVMPEVYKAYTKQVTSHKFSIAG